MVLIVKLDVPQVTQETDGNYENNITYFQKFPLNLL